MGSRPPTPLIPTFYLFRQIIWNAIYFRFSRQKVGIIITSDHKVFSTVLHHAPNRHHIHWRRLDSSLMLLYRWPLSSLSYQRWHKTVLLYPSLHGRAIRQPVEAACRSCINAWPANVSTYEDTNVLVHLTIFHVHFYHSVKQISLHCRWTSATCCLCGQYKKDIHPAFFQHGTCEGIHQDAGRFFP